MTLFHQGVTLLDVARDHGHVEVVTFLETIASTTTATNDRDKVSCCAPSDERECANCSATEGHAGVKLVSCSRCLLVYYCGKACQLQHWKEGGHKKRCIPLTERSLKAAEHPGSQESTQVEKCPICLVSLSSEATSSLGCGHVLHLKCMKEMMSSGGARVCPICRSGL